MNKFRNRSILILKFPVGLIQIMNPLVKNIIANAPGKKTKKKNEKAILIRKLKNKYAAGKRIYK